MASEGGRAPRMPHSHCSKFWTNEDKLETFILFIDYEKAYANLNREKLWRTLREENTNAASESNTVCVSEFKDTRKIKCWADVRANYHQQRSKVGTWTVTRCA